jgi:hypothetical protein
VEAVAAVGSQPEMEMDGRNWRRRGKERRIWRRSGG